MIKGGYFGKYLIIDLTNKTFREEELSEDIMNKYLGGRGIATKLLFDLQEGKIDALAPESNLIIFTGPVGGTNVPGSSRIFFGSKSPLSNAINTTSMGGIFPNTFKKTGYDGVVIQGRADDKTWIHVTPGNVQFHSAEDVWGLKTSDAEKIIKEKAGSKSRVALIGPAGEKQVLFSAIVSDTRTAGRGGTGAVMGSKNLKAIAVSGDVKVPVADKDAMDKISKKIREEQAENPSALGMNMNGSAGLVSPVNAMGALPTKNFQQGTFEGADEMGGYAITEKNRVKAVACASCTVACSLISEAKNGKYAGTTTEGPEYESDVMLGSNIMVDDTDIIICANHLCDEYGIDTISTGNVIGFAMECYQRGLLTEKDTGGLALNWGDGDVILELIELIGKNEGFGKRLGQGVLRLSKEIPGSESFAMHVKGLEIAAYDPRAVFGQALSYAVAPRGGEHGRGGYMIVEFFQPDSDLYTHVGKAKKAAELSEAAAMYDIASVCSFNFIPTSDIPELINSVVGTNYTEDDLRQITRNVMTLERKFNNREGFTRKDDTLPSRLLNEPLPDGEAKGKKVEGLDIMLDEYYALRGWDKEGIPKE